MEGISKLIVDKKIIVICRKLYGDELLKTADALFEGGIRLLEITFDQSDIESLKKTSAAIETLVSRFDGRLQVGAGTVLSRTQVSAAKDSGANYIISPNTDSDIIAFTKAQGLVSIPGAMTPSEIISAHNAGADFVKIFPATSLGFHYIKDILAPINHLKLIATGGVTEENFSKYLELGFTGAGISGRLTDKSLIEAGQYEELTSRARSFVSITNFN